MITLERMDILKIPMHLVQSVRDQGTSRAVMPDGSFDEDDLRIVIELSGGHLCFLDLNQDFYIFDGHLHICEYRPAN